ncbi:hypothetical protein SAMN06297387_12520 [Streptomyces zhaozhouensis]|uniref:Secreted protein n=1 Tax=Streptomyces zhaozhouensis TaxID=1300267 RepID=A0A286E5Z8_9ACTN|nr:hypothetical protein [Streptomyces zhaozhouensis]SOD66299.1 hypothetical protein SAMN06297387_12520 [Streptomyces zhaozhouensis]
MTQPPSAPPGAPPAFPAPRAEVPAGSPAPSPPVERPGRLGALSGCARRLRAAFGTEPGRLRLIGLALAGLLLLFGVTTYWQLSDRAEAARTARETSQPLSRNAADIYRYLADANTTAASGFLAGADEPRNVRNRYVRHISNASELLASAAGHGQGSALSAVLIARLNAELPRYTGLVETARANDRQRLPLGSAYLRYADERMQDTLLATADELYRLETARYRADLAEARAWPWLSIGLGVASVGALGWAQRRHYLRTHRVLNPGLVAATTAAGLLLLWVAGGHLMASSSLEEAESGPGRALTTLSDARTEALLARGAENLTLVARGGDSTFDEKYISSMDRLLAPPDDARAGLLLLALAQTEDESRTAVKDAIAAARVWEHRHEEARRFEMEGDYNGAIRQVIGNAGSTGESFDRVNNKLSDAVDRQQRQFLDAAQSGLNWLGVLPPAAVVLVLLAAAGTARGVARPLAEYR